MEFLKNFYKDDDKMIGLACLKKKKSLNFKFNLEKDFSSLDTLFAPRKQYKAELWM